MKVLLLLFLLPFFLFSQKKKNQKDTSRIISQPDRIEFSKKREESEFYVITGDTHGVLVVEDTRTPVKEGGYEWVLHMVDTAFNVLWSHNLSIPLDGSLLGYEYFDDQFYLLFNKNRYRSQDLLVLQVKIASKEFLSYDITTVFPIELTHFESLNETLILAGYANFRPVVITYNIHDKIPRVAPGFYNNNNDMLDLIVDKESELFTVTLSEKMRNKKFTVRVKTFTSNGDLIQDNLINPGEKKSLIDAASTTFSNGLQYLAGTYSKKSLYYSRGFYLSKFINGFQQYNKYYPFADLNNFFAYLKPKREGRIKNRIEQKRRKGKIKKFSYRLLVHKIIKRDDEYIVIAEAYYPRYNYSNNAGTTFFPNNSGSSLYSGVPRTLTPYFLGYKYTHAVVVGFDRNCNIRWDNTFRIEDIQSYSIKENVKVSTAGENIVLMYLEENEIRSKVIKGNEIVEGRTFNPIRLAFETDQVKNKDPQVEGLEYWFDDTLFAYGEQVIKNENRANGSVDRKVFYLNKVRFNKTVN